jgi:hypothetical protein
LHTRVLENLAPQRQRRAQRSPHAHDAPGASVRRRYGAGIAARDGAPARRDKVVELAREFTPPPRIAVDGTLDPSGATAGLKSLLTRAGRAEDFADLELRLAATQDRVRATFERLFRAS